MIQQQAPIDLIVLIVPLLTLFVSVIVLIIQQRMNRDMTRLAAEVLSQKARLDDVRQRVWELENHL